MIKVTRINKVEKFWINEHQIEYLEETPDTILTMVSGRKYAVAETADEIQKMIIEVKRAAFILRDEDGKIVE
jgi:flagellar protein FlbD